MDLGEGCGGVGAVSGGCGQVEDWHLGFEGVGVDVVDFGGGFGAALGGNPGDVAVGNEDDVGR